MITQLNCKFFKPYKICFGCLKEFLQGDGSFGCCGLVKGKVVLHQSFYLDVCLVFIQLS